MLNLKHTYCTRMHEELRHLLHCYVVSFSRLLRDRNSIAHTNNKIQV